jgi:electron transport complex protein RnfC
VVNVATTAEIGRLLPHGRGIQERVVTITGPGVKKKGNYLIPIGTPLRYVLEQVGVADNISEVYMGGPMMGVAVSNLDISIVKGTSGILVLPKTSASPGKDLRLYQMRGLCRCLSTFAESRRRLGLLAKFEAYDDHGGRITT